MKVNFKKIVLSSISLLTLGGICTNVFADTLEYGEVVKDNNTVTVPIILNVSEGEEVSNVKFGCYSRNADVSCEIKAVSPTKAQMSGNVATFAYLNTDAETQTNLFKVGKTTIANIIYTNNDTSQKIDFEFGLENASITSNNIVKSVSIDINKVTIAAKKVERTMSTDARLGSVKVTQGTIVPDFNPDTFEYTIYNIADTVNSIKFSLSCNDGDTCSYDYPSGGKSTSGYTVSLNQGENAVSITSHSEDGSNSITYKFNVIRGETIFNSSKLASLEISDYTLTPVFNKTVYEYSVTVPNTQTSLINNLNYKAEDEKAKVTTSGLDNFQEGENKLTITVANVLGDEETVYLIKVKRMTKEDIEVVGYKDGVVSYKDSEGNAKKLKEDEFKKFYIDEYNKIINKTYTFDVNGNIVVASDIKTDENKEEKEETKEKSNIVPIVIIIIVGLGIIIISGILIFRKKKEPNVELPVEKEIDENGIEETIISENKVTEEVTTNTMDIDEALNDLMSTKSYNFKDDE